jgi:MSHA biogenesis protein MshI
LFSFLGKTKRHLKVGIALTAEGCAFAEVSTDQASPLLNRCGFVSSQPGEAIANLQDLIKQERLTNADLAICLDRSRFNLSLIEAPQVEATEMHQALAWKVKDLIDYPLDKLVLDYVDVPSTKSSGAMVYTVAVNETNIQALVDEVGQAHGLLERIDIPALAQQNLASHLPVADEGVALLNLTHRDSLLTLGRGEKLYLARGVGVHCNELRSEMLPEGDRQSVPRLDDLLLDIQRSLDYYDSFFSDPPIRHLVIPSMNGQYDHLVDYLQRNMAIGVAEMQLDQVLSPGQQLSIETDYFGELILATGTALWPKVMAA